MYQGDKEYFDRVDYEEKIGMKKLITKYGNKNGYKGDKYFLACSPKWIDYDDAENREKRKAEMKTEYDIMYWINYSDDDENHGWYTVEQIKKWLTTKGLHLIEIKKD
jgi:ribosome-binding ATPase YchF (GTP1/OBG family)